MKKINVKDIGTYDNLCDQAFSNELGAETGDKMAWSMIGIILLIGIVGLFVWKVLA